MTQFIVNDVVYSEIGETRQKLDFLNSKQSADTERMHWSEILNLLSKQRLEDETNCRFNESSQSNANLH